MQGGTVYCWGRGDYGSLGNGTTPSSSFTAVRVTGISTATSVAAGACAVLATGHVECWGANRFGELGDGTTTDSSVPVAVKGISDAVEVAVGLGHACAVLVGGGLDCWGDNEEGLLGTGIDSGPENCPGEDEPIFCSTYPLPVTGISNATHVSISVQDFTCATLFNGHVKCWGTNEYGQLGDDTVSGPELCAELGEPVEHPCSRIPVEVFKLTDAVGIFTVDLRTCAVLTSGELACRGFLSPTASTTFPVLVSGIGEAVAVAPGGVEACVSLASGQIDCWEAGDIVNVEGSLDLQPQLVALPGVTDAVSISSSYFYWCLARRSGEAECWGSNEWGELGDGTETSHLTPMPVLTTA